MRCLKRTRRSLAIVLALLTGGVVTPVSATAATDSVFEITAELPVPGGEYRGGAGSFVHVDEEKRRGYYVYSATGPAGTGDWTLVEYDLRTSVPRAMRELPLGITTVTVNSFSENVVAYDETRNRLLVVGSSDHLVVLPAVTFVTEVDLEAWSASEWTNAQLPPGFVATGIDYSLEDDQVYLLGEWTGLGVTSFGAGAFGRAITPVGVAALDAGSGALSWARPVPECQNQLTRGASGGFVQRSAHAAVLYFVCVEANVFSTKVAGQSGLIRLHLPDDGGSVGLLEAPVDFFPVSGTFQGGSSIRTGEVTYDPVTDRVFLLSLSKTTPSVWVFDGRASTWVGSVGTPNDTFDRLGFDERNGRLYVGGSGNPLIGRSPGLLVTDGRATPPPQGTIDERFVVRAPIAADGQTDRVFVAQGEGNQVPFWQVLLDRSEPIEPLGRPAYDMLTADVPEGVDTTAQFAGGTRAYGSRVTLVGGAEAPLVNALSGVGGESLNFETFSPVSTGDRSLAGGDIASLDIGGFGVSAAAQALAPDAGSLTDLSNVSDQAGGSDDGTEEEADGPSEGTDSEEDPDDGNALTWPWDLTECSDGGRTPGTSAHEGPQGLGDVTVSCDLERAQGSATSTYEGALEVGEAVSIGRSHADSQAWRDPLRGAVTQTHATVDGIELRTPGGSVSIGRVTATATTTAKGQTGTSSSRWVRRIEGVAVRDADGQQVFPPDDGTASCLTIVTTDGDGSVRELGSCKQVVEAIRPAVQNRFEVLLPTPEVVATPKGAFAAVERDAVDASRASVMYNDGGREVPALALVFYNDGAQKSRAVIQLAGISANSIYTITKFETFEPLPNVDFDPEAILDGAIGTLDLTPTAPEDDVPGTAADLSSLVGALSSFLENAGSPGETVAGSGDAVSPQPPPGSDEVVTGGGDVPPSFDPPTGDFGSVAAPVDSAPPFVPTVPAPTEDGPPVAEPGPAVAAPGGEFGAPPGPQPPSTAVPPQGSGPAVLARGAGDAALVAGLWLMFGGALAMSVRRRLLGQLLQN